MTMNNKTTEAPEQTIDKLHRETGIPIWALEIAFELSTRGMLDEETMAGMRVIPDAARVIAESCNAPTTPDEADKALAEEVVQRWVITIEEGVLKPVGRLTGLTKEIAAALAQARGETWEKAIQLVDGRNADPYGPSAYRFKQKVVDALESAANRIEEQ